MSVAFPCREAQRYTMREPPRRSLRARLRSSACLSTRRAVTPCLSLHASVCLHTSTGGGALPSSPPSMSGHKPPTSPWPYTPTPRLSTSMRACNGSVKYPKPPRMYQLWPSIAKQKPRALGLYCPVYGDILRQESNAPQAHLKWWRWILKSARKSFF